MIGKYDIDDEKIRNLPRISSTIENCHPKLLDYSNTAYVDNFFYFLGSILLNHHGFLHGIDYYGSFLSIQNKFRMNIEDDLEYLTGSPFFLDNIGKIMTLENYDQENIQANLVSRKNRHKITFEGEYQILDTISTIDIDDFCHIDSDSDHVYEDHVEIVYKSIAIDESDKESDDSSENSDTNYSTASDEETKNMNGSDNGSEYDSFEDEEDDDDEYDESNDTIAYINNFPIQMICLEKCHGTMDELFVKNLINEINGASMLFQVIIILLTYQKAFNFTHNDLHANNIMYVTTKRKFLTYKYNNHYYKVPTYGYIFKIIDYGRSIYKYQGKQFCSDSFDINGDAVTQYNCEPFFDDKKPRLDPNYSFDLCRLGCSIYDFIIHEDTDMKNLDMLQTIIKLWTTDDNNRNILYKKNGSERYHGFKLYKMISRTVHSHTPENQLKYPFFNQFLVKINFTKKKTLMKELMDIDALPSYI